MILHMVSHPTQTLFFALLRMAVGTGARLPKAPTAEEWEALLHEAKRQTLVGVLYDALDRLPAEQRPPKPVLLRWHALTERIAHDNLRLNRDAVWLTERFARAGFRSVVLKGQGNALLYPHPLRRHPGDIDIWLDGRRDDILAYVLRLFPKQKVQWLEVEFPVLKETVTEVHTAPSNLYCPTDNNRLQAFYARHREAMFTHATALPDGIIFTPTWEVNLVFQLTHIYRHLFYEGIGLRQLMDYFFLLQRGEGEGMKGEKLEEARQVVCSLHMERFAGALMWVLGEVFGLENEHMYVRPNEEEGRFLLSEVIEAGNFGHYDERITRATSPWGNFWQITNRNWRFLTRYPREVFWNPVYRLRQYVWRKRKGYC